GAAGVRLRHTFPTRRSSDLRELVIAAWGDPYEAAWRKSLIPEFEKQNNVKIIWVQGFSSQTLAKLRAQKDNPQIDVAMMDDGPLDRKSTRLNSSHVAISYAV